MSSCDKLLERKPLPCPSSHDLPHAVGDGQGEHVVAPRELGNVAVKVLGAHPTVRAVVAALEKRLKRLDAVGVTVPAHVLAAAVVDGLMACPALVDR